MKAVALLLPLLLLLAEPISPSFAQPTAVSGDTAAVPEVAGWERASEDGGGAGGEDLHGLPSFAAAAAAASSNLMLIHKEQQQEQQGGGDDEAPTAAAEGEEQGQEEGGEEDDGAPAVRMTLLCIVTVIVLCTMAFERMKEEVIERTPEKQEKVIESLFSEMTVLGFLGLVVFTVSKLGVLDVISADVFGESESGEIAEFIEITHYVIFLVMVLFICQVLLLTVNGSESERAWMACNTAVQNPRDMQALADRLRKPPPGIFDIAGRRAHHKDIHLLMFKSLRAEFIKGRNLLPPFGEFDEKDQLPGNFRYDLYLAYCLGDSMAKVVEVPINTLAVVWLIAVTFFVTVLASAGNTMLLCLIWGGLGYPLAIFFEIFHNKVCRIKFEHLAGDFMQDFTTYSSVLGTLQLDANGVLSPIMRSPAQSPRRSINAGREHLIGISPSNSPMNSPSNSPNNSNSNSNSNSKSRKRGGVETEHGYGSIIQQGGVMLTNAGGGSINNGQKDMGRGREEQEEEVLLKRHRRGMPGWTRFSQPDKKTNKLERWMYGSSPSRQHQLFWFHERGPEFHLFLLRLMLLLMAIDLSILLLHFARFMWLEEGPLATLAYLIVAVLPFAWIYAHINNLVRRVVHVNNIGGMRKPMVVAKVKKDMKTINAMKALFLLHELRHKLQCDHAVGRASLEEGGDTVSRHPAFVPRQGTISEEGAEGQADHLAPPSAVQQQQQQPQRGGESEESEENPDRAHMMAQMKKRRSSCLLHGSNLMKTQLKEERLAFWGMDPDGGTNQFSMPQMMGKLAVMGIDPQQVIEVGKLFNNFDVDNSGSIDEAELRTLMGAMGKPLDELEVHALMTKVDIDGDGTVSWCEFMLWQMEALANSDNCRSRGRDQSEQEPSDEDVVNALFLYFDPTGTGEVSTEEFMNGMKSLDVGLGEVEIGELIYELDTDHDGSVSSEEFSRLFERHKIHMGKDEPIRRRKDR